MTALTDYSENFILDWWLRGQARTPPTTVYVGLLTTNPTADAGTGAVEVTGGAYARQAVACTATGWRSTQGDTAATSTGTGGTTANNALISFPAPTANWGVVTGVAVYDALTAGNMLWWAAQTPNKTVNNGDPGPTIAAGALTLQLDN